jgi:hypothetical protein
VGTFLFRFCVDVTLIGPARWLDRQILHADRVH